jgi:hypothetical protein
MLDDHLDDLFGSGRAFIKDKEPTVTIKGNMDEINDQENIKFVLMQGEIDTLKSKVECLEECEDLRDQQMKVLETALNKTIAYIERDGYEWKVLDVPKAKE